MQHRWILSELIECIAKKLSTHNATQEARWLLEGLFKKSWSDLMRHSFIDVSQDQQQQLDEWIRLRVDEHKPLQYILGSVPFADLDILVQSPILIPRPETEEWVVWLIDELKAVKNNPLTFLDMCTGSGCIALTLAHHFPRARVIGVDINPQAIQLAEKNKLHNKIQNVRFIQSDLFASLDSSMKFDCIVSNPPYITSIEYSTLDRGVVAWEDRQALVAGDNGLAFYKHISAKALSYLEKQSILNRYNMPRLVFELGTRPKETESVVLQSGFSKSSIFQDMQGVDRWLGAYLTD